MRLRQRLGVFGIRDFAIYWAGGLLSNVGTWLQNIAAAVFMYILTGSPLMVGLLNFAGFLPILLFSLFGGVVSDRFDRRRVIVVTNLASMTIVFVVAALAFAGLVTPPVLILAAFVTNTSYAFGKPSTMSLLPYLVPRERLAEATGLNLLQFTGGQVGGSLLAAIVLATLGPAWAFLINGFTFLGPSIAAMVIRAVPPPDPAARRTSGLRAIREGVSYVSRSRLLLATLLGVAATSALAEVLRTLSPVLATQAFGQPESSTGFLITAWGVGSAFAILAVGPLSRRVDAWVLAATGAVLHGASAVAIGLAPSFTVGLGAAFSLGIGYSLAFTVLTARLQEHADDRFRGRVLSLHTLSHLGMRPFNALVAGAVGSVVGVRLAFGIFALLGPAALLAIALARRPGDRAAAATEHEAAAGRQPREEIAATILDADLGG
jgi:MFS family permease